MSGNQVERSPARHCLRGGAVIATLMLLLGVRSTAGGEYSDPSGFSFVYPEGWFAASSSLVTSNLGLLPPEVRNWLEKNRVDLDKVKMILVREGHDDFLENLNVVVSNQQMPMNDTSLNDLLKKLPRQYISMGAKLEGLEGRARKLGTNEAIVVDYRITLPGAERALRQRQAYVPGGGKTYIVTCTGKADTFAAHAQTFETILASLKVPAPIAQAAAWKRGLAAGIIPGIIGGVAGTLIVLFGKLIGSRHKAPRAEEPPAALD